MIHMARRPTGAQERKPLRYAHPFFTATPPHDRPADFSRHGRRMASWVAPKAGAANPALFLHLGDVIYGPHKEQLYRDEFYRPYMKYPGKIAAIPGNHDGEVFAETDPEPL